MDFMIYISDTLRVSKLDDICLQIEMYESVTSKKTHETTMQWKWAGYYGDLKSALYGALKKQLLKTVDEELSLNEVIDKITAAENNIIKAVESLKIKE